MTLIPKRIGICFGLRPSRSGSRASTSRATLHVVGLRLCPPASPQHKVHGSNLSLVATLRAAHQVPTTRTQQPNQAKPLRLITYEGFHTRNPNTNTGKPQTFRDLEGALTVQAGAPFTPASLGLVSVHGPQLEQKRTFGMNARSSACTSQQTERTPPSAISRIPSG